MIKNSKFALSPIGIAIAIICLLAVVMIITTPMIVDKYHSNRGEIKNEQMPKEISRIDMPTVNEPNQPNIMESKIEQLSQRIDEVERFARNIQIQGSNMRNQNKNSYNCTIEGVVDENGNMVPASKVKATTPETKYVFVCGKN